jgi:glycerol kinase
VGAIDQGTTSTRFVIVDHSGSFVSMAQQEHRQIYPQPGWVEHDPGEIWANTELVVRRALAEAGLSASNLAGVGITNQRETTVVWSTVTGRPVANAIVWQDTRTAELCRVLAADHGADRFRAITGLPLATYFAAPKLRWLIDNEPEVAKLAASGELAFGTIDAWLAWNLTGRHVTDVTNASRTLLMDLATLDWSPDAVRGIGVPDEALPDIVASSQVIGECRGVLDGVPLAGILGDQQAALFGQACFTPGQGKNTYGTGCFLLLNTGVTPVWSGNGLLTTVAYRLGDEAAVYALEGSVAIAGAAVQWLRDNLGLITEAAAVEDLARSVDDNGGVYFVPAFSGLFAPYWRDDARGVIAGLTRYATAGHIARATLEAVAFQTRDVVGAMEADSGVVLEGLKVDGGMVKNELLMQFQADILDVPVVVPQVTETTVLGAAYAAGLAVGLWSDLATLARHWHEERRYLPEMDPTERSGLVAGWAKAIDRSMGWLP